MDEGLPRMLYFLNKPARKMFFDYKYKEGPHALLLMFPEDILNILKYLEAIYSECRVRLKVKAPHQNLTNVQSFQNTNIQF